MHDEIPESVARAVGHVCGVISVGVAALSVVVIVGLARKPSVAALILCALSMGLTALMFRWAGALTGYWDTSGRLAVPKVVYGVFGVALVCLSAVGAYLLVVDMPASFGKALAIFVGVLCGAAVAYLCYLATQRFK